MTTFPQPRPSRVARLTEQANRKALRRSKASRNSAGLALPKPEVWQDPKYRAWVTKRYRCAIAGKADHACGPRIDRKVIHEFAHTQTEGRGIKASDNHGMSLCADAHQLQHTIGWPEFERRYAMKREEIARSIFESSPWATKVEVTW